MLLADAIHDFLVACEADGLRPATLRWYTSRLNGLAGWYADQEVDELTANHLRRYVVALRNRRTRYPEARQRPELAGGLSPATIQGHIRALRTFFRWCMAEYMLDKVWNPIARIRMPKVGQTPKAASLDDLNRLLAIIDDSALGRRNRAIFLFLVDTGCRAGGLLGLRLADLDLEAGRAVVTEKGEKTRTVYLLKPTCIAVQRWLDMRAARCEFVFVTQQGQPLTYGGLANMVRRLKKKAGVTGRVNPHAWRHMLGNLWIESGGDPASLQRILGHADVATTLRYYVQISDPVLQEKHGQFSPVRSLDER